MKISIRKKKRGNWWFSLLVVSFLLLSSFSFAQTLFEISAGDGLKDISGNNISVEGKDILIKEENGKKSFFFNGETSFMVIEKSPVFNLTKDFGIEAEIKVYPEQKEETKGYQRIFSHVLFNPRGGYELAIHGGKLSFWTSGKGWIMSSLFVTDGKWHKVGVKAGKEKVIFYVDDKTEEGYFYPCLPCEGESAIGALSADTKQSRIFAELRSLKVFKLAEEEIKKIDIKNKSAFLSWYKNHLLPSRNISFVERNNALENILRSEPLFKGSDFLIKIQDRKVHMPGEKREITWKKSSVSSKVWVVITPKELVIHFYCMEPEISKIKTDQQKKDGRVWEDDSVEVYLDTNRDRNTYFHIIANSKGIIYDAFCSVPQYADASWDSGAKAKPSLSKDSWSITLFIPLENLGGYPSPGDIWGINFGRIRKVHEEESAICPVYSCHWHAGNLRKLIDPASFIPIKIGNNFFVSSPSRGSLSGEKQGWKNCWVVNFYNPGNEILELKAKLTSEEKTYKSFIVKPDERKQVSIPYILKTGTWVKLSIVDKKNRKVYYMAEYKIQPERKSTLPIRKGKFESKLIKYGTKLPFPCGSMSWPHQTGNPPESSYKILYPCLLKYGVSYNYEERLKEISIYKFSPIVAYRKKSHHTYNDLDHIAKYFRKYKLKAVLMPLVVIPEGKNRYLFINNRPYHLHPEIQKLYLENMKEGLKKYKDVIWAVLVEDEMYYHLEKQTLKLLKEPPSGYKNYAERIKEEITEIGFGKYGPPLDKNSSPFQWIAFRRWLSLKMDNFENEIVREARKIKPDIIMISNDCCHGISPYNLRRWSKNFDIVPHQLNFFPKNPYKTAATTKFLSDIIKKPIWLCPHYEGWFTFEEMHQALSNIFINGGDGLLPYPLTGSRYLRHEAWSAPDKWKYTLYLSKWFTEKNPEIILPKPEVAVFYSNDSDMAIRSSSHVASAYALLGPGCGTSLKFIDDEGIEKNLIDFSNVKIIIVPPTPIQRKKVVEKIFSLCEKGKILVIAGHNTFSKSDRGENLGYLIKEILKDTTFSKDSFLVGEGEKLKVSGDFKIKEVENKTASSGKSFMTGKNDRIILSHPKKGVLAIEKKYGRGKIIWFSFDPFQWKHVTDKKWISFFKEIAQDLGVKIDYPFWNFKLPLPFTLREPEKGLCLTNNYIFWKDARPYFYSNSEPVRGKYKYNIPPDSPQEDYKKEWISFSKGKLTDRFYNLIAPPKYDNREVSDFVVGWKNNKPIEIIFDLEQYYNLEGIKLIITDYFPRIESFGSKDGKKWKKLSEMEEKGSIKNKIEEVSLDLKRYQTRYIKLEFGERPAKQMFTISEIEIWAEYR